MSRLPTVGADDNDWGNVLNDFLQVAHNADGTLKSTTSIALGYLPQSGFSAPVFTAITDTIAGTWARTSTGIYTLTKPGTFLASKTIPLASVYYDDTGNKYTLERTSDDVMTLKTYAAADISTLSDNVLSNFSIKVEVYA